MKQLGYLLHCLCIYTAMINLHFLERLLLNDLPNINLNARYQLPLLLSLVDLSLVVCLASLEVHGVLRVLLLFLLLVGVWRLRIACQWL